MDPPDHNNCRPKRLFLHLIAQISSHDHSLRSKYGNNLVLAKLLRRIFNGTAQDYSVRITAAMISKPIRTGKRHPSPLPAFEKLLWVLLFGLLFGLLFPADVSTLEDLPFLPPFAAELFPFDKPLSFDMVPPCDHL
jgi:hypothetical protein